MNEAQKLAHDRGYWQLTNPLHITDAADVRFLGGVLADMDRGNVTRKVIQVQTSDGPALEVWRKGGVAIDPEE